MFEVMSFARRFAALSGCILTMSVCQPCLSFAQVSVLTQHNDTNRDGLNSSETILTPSNVNRTDFGLLFKLPVDDQVYSQPLYVHGVSISGGTHNVLYVATANNSVYAFDADSGTQYWHVNLGTAFTIQDGGFTCGDVLASSGIMGTPVINGNNLYVVAETWSGSSATHHLHSLNISTGADNSGSPVTISATNFTSKLENQRPGLLYANGNIYFSFAGHCDQQTWKGFTFAYSASSLAQVGVFDASPSDNGAGIWMSGNGAAADSSGNVYVMTGNGTWDGENNFSESFLKFNSTLGLLDWHTPSDYSTLDDEDLDLTASGPLLIPGTSLVVGGGKDGVLHLVKTGDLGHLGDSTAVQNWQASSSHIHSMNYWNGDLYLWGQADYMRVYSFGGSTFNTTPKYELSIQAIGHPGASLSISSNGNSNGILWAYTNSAGTSDGSGAWHMTEPGILYAYNASNMSLLYTNEQNSSRDDCNNYAKFQPPTIVNGKVYLASFGTAQTKSGQVCVYGELSTGGCTPTAITPYIQVNGGSWAQESSATVASGSTVNLGPQPGTGGSWSWTGPNGFASTSRQINDIPLSTGTNTFVATYTNSGGCKSSDTFTITVSGSGSNLIANGTYVITSVLSGLALGDPGSSKTDGTDMETLTLTNATNQQWTVNNLGNNVITLTNVASGQLLDVAGASISDGALVDQWPATGNTNQQWNVISLGGGNFELTSVNSGLALDVVKAGTTSGTGVDQWPYESNPNQQWTFKAP